MEQERYDLPELLRGVAALIAGVLGPSAEVAVHDLEKEELLVVQNGRLTGRKPGPTNDAQTIRMLAESADADGCLIGYRSASNGRSLRASNLFIRDDKGRVRYVVCVNQDLDALEQAGRLLSELSGVRPRGESMPEKKAGPRQMIRSVILDEVERAKPFSLRSRAGRMIVLERLEERGAFEIRGAVEEVCEMLEISQATVYNDLRSLRGQKKEKAVRRRREACSDAQTDR